MKIQDIMSKDVAYLSKQDSIEQAAWLMKQHDVGSIPICEQNRVIGIVTDRDIALRSVANAQAEGLTVGDIMTQNPIVGNPDMDVEQIATMMSENQIRRLPIVENGQLVGIVALGDISVQRDHQPEAEQALSNISKPCSHT